MIEIQIEQFAGYDAETFFEFLKMEKDPNVRIELPKKTALYKSSHWEIALEYSMMALFGQRLFDVEGNIYIKYPPMNRREPFAFELKTEKRKVLAGWLAWMAGFYAGEEEQRLAYCKEAEYFVHHLDGLEVGCTDYVAVAHQFWMMHREEEKQGRMSEE